MEEIEILKKAGLTDVQAAVYDSLLKNGEQTPTEIAAKTGQSRENCYAVAKRLMEVGLIEQTDKKKTSYRVLNPSALETLVEKRRRVVAKNEKYVKDNISSLLDIFYANNETPGARTLEGIEGIKEVYKDALRAKKDIYLLRTKGDELLGYDGSDDRFMHDYREQRALLGIKTYALTPVDRHAIKNQKTGRDVAISFYRTWMPEEDYTAPMEIQVYGDKVALISFGETAMATIITSPVIAEAMRQILKLLMDFYKKSYPQKY